MAAKHYALTGKLRFSNFLPKSQKQSLLCAICQSLGCECTICPNITNISNCEKKGEKNVDAKIFGQFVAQTRREKNMTQAELAQKINVTDKAVSRWERGV